MSPRESVDEKARPYLAEGWVAVEHADSGTVRASCRGSDVVCRVGFGGGVWRCECPARGRCAHLVAVGLVAPRPAA